MDKTLQGDVLKILDGVELGKQIFREHTDYDKLKAAVPYLIRTMCKASENKSLKPEHFAEMAVAYDKILEVMEVKP